jgi:hypothetical protein
VCQSQLHMSAAAVYVPEDMDARSRFSDGSPQHRAAHPVIENSSRRAVGVSADPGTASGRGRSRSLITPQLCMLSQLAALCGKG